ncbi:SAF domain-containing protein [Parafrankia sp. EUN1f]|uniref:SAF domain-containing protein n=1 Tax=Parafrankia sp. EUN1f TaxID=102897 RepID=UPI0012FAD193|nr:SAF domain-containing protein [Parafrankia sp. EUN1f]
MTTGFSPAGVDVDQGQDEWTPHDPEVASPFAGLRRRWGGAAAALLLMLVGAAGAVWLASDDSGRSIEVVTLTRPLARGTEVTPSDLAVVRVDVEGSGVRLTAPAAARGELVGRQALIDLPAGTLISPEMVGSVALPTGTVTLGVTVSAQDLPSAAMRPGEQVSVLGYPLAAGGPQLLARGVTVTEVQRPQTAGQPGQTVVYLQLPEQAAMDVAAAATLDQGVRLLGSAPAAAGNESRDGG